MLAALAAVAGKFQTLNNSWWWAMVPGVTAFFAALYTQKVERLSSQLNYLFWMQGAATGLVSILVFILLYSDVLWGKSAQQLSGEAKLSVLAFGLYVGFTTAILGLALGRILHMWVTAERCAGQSDRRQGKRQSFLFKRATWRTDSAELPVRAVAMSSSGGELKTATPLEAESEGQIEIAGRKPRRAQVLRNDPEDSRRSFIRFLDEAA